MELTLLNEKVNAIAATRKAKAAIQEEVDQLRADFEDSIKGLTGELKTTATMIEEYQNEVLAALRESGSKNWKTENATVTRKSTFSYKVLNKEEVISWLDKKGILSEYTTQEIAPHAKSLFESQEIPGVERTEKEFISVIVK